MGVCWESSLASLPREPPMSIGGIIIKIYCAVRYFGYGDDRCFARGGKVLYKLYEMAGAMIKKLFMSSASSAIGTGTVLGVHSALAPETPSIQGSDLRQATVDESKNLMKIDMSGASSSPGDHYLPAPVYHPAHVLLWLLATQTEEEEGGGKVEERSP